MTIVVFIRHPTLQVDIESSDREFPLVKILEKHESIPS